MPGPARHPEGGIASDAAGRLISKLDFVAVPSTDAERSRSFYLDTLSLKPDDRARFDFWVAGTCFSIYEPSQFGMEFEAQKTAPLALHVDDIELARKELEEKGVQFSDDTLDTGVCHMAFFADPDGNRLILHHRYAPFTDGSKP